MSQRSILEVVSRQRRSHGWYYWDHRHNRSGNWHVLAGDGRYHYDESSIQNSVPTYVGIHLRNTINHLLFISWNSFTSHCLSYSLPSLQQLIHCPFPISSPSPTFVDFYDFNPRPSFAYHPPPSRTLPQSSPPSSPPKNPTKPLIIPSLPSLIPTYSRPCASTARCICVYFLLNLCKSG